jgi:hypothetical protein
MLTFVLLLLIAYYYAPEREARFIEVQLQRNPKTSFTLTFVSFTTSLLLCPRKEEREAYFIEGKVKFTNFAQQLIKLYMSLGHKKLVPMITYYKIKQDQNILWLTFP